MGNFLITGAILLALIPSASFANETNDRIKEKMIQQSIAGYPGRCPCPYFSDRRGRACGGRSAWSRAGGASPLCFKTDISDEMVKRFINK